MPAELVKKIVGVRLEKTLERDEKGFLKVRGFFTSDQRDEVGDIITRAATEKAIPAYRQWGNIRRMHAPDPVGRVLGIGTKDGLEWNEVEILVIDPKAIFEVENGLLKALSVGILVNTDMVDMMRDGGFVINEYQLAEISLVDHPANYDARLFLGLNLDKRERMLVRELGVHEYLANKKNLESNQMEEKTQPAAAEEQPVMETPVETEKDITADQPVTEPVAEVEAVAEAPVTEAVAKEVTEPVAVEASLEPAVEEQLTTEPAAEAVAETPAVVEASIDSEPKTHEVAELKDLVVSLAKSVATLTEIVLESVNPSQPATEEVTSEADSDVPQATDEAEVDVTKDLGAPANRTSAVVPEPTPTEPEAATEEPAPVAKPKSLREAVKLFSESRNK
jgi:hypothetical protein